MKSLLKVFSLSLFTLLTIYQTKAQVSKKTMVEHFTNTKCSTCASRNPGLIANFNSNPQVLNISIHPSSPYSTCFLSQQNKIDNDARTNYYSIYGSTPRIVINGNVISGSANYADTSIFNSYAGNTPFSISIEQFAVHADSIRSDITIKRVVAGTPIGNAMLFAGIVEDTVFGNGGNGEQQHYNVLRRSLYGAAGMPITLPVNTGDSVVVSNTQKYDAVWDKIRMRTVAILQDSSTKALIQSELSSTNKQGVTTGLANLTSNNNSISVYPNPFHNKLFIAGTKDELLHYELLSIQGAVIKKGVIDKNQTLHLETLPYGVYLIRLSDSRQVYMHKIIKH